MNDHNPAKKLQFWHWNKLPIIIQSETAECGLACLAMVANYYGYRTDMLSLRRQFNMSIEGVTLHDVMQFADKLALSTRPLRIELNDLVDIKKPCILHWDMNHFVVLKKVDSKHIVIHDPAIGERKLTLAQASKHFTGVALELSPTKDFIKKDKKQTLKFSDFWTRITGLNSSLLLIFSLSLLLQIFALSTPYYIQLVIDEVIISADTSLLVILAIGFFLILIFEAITTALRGLTLLHFGNLLNIQLGSNLFHHLIRLPLEYFEKRHMGDIVSRFNSLQQVKELLTTGVIETIIDGLMAVITLMMIFFYSPKLSFVVLLIIVIYAAVRIAMYRPFRAISEQEIVAKAEENSNFMESVKGIQAIKLFGSEASREGQWQNRYANAINQNIRLGNYEVSYHVINRFLFGLENIVVIYLAAMLVIKGGFSIGMLFAFMAYKNQFMDKMSKLIDKIIEFKMLSLHFERLSDIALSEKECLKLENTITHDIKGKITIKGLFFKYSDVTEDILKNINLEIFPGESVAITGPSGCGKSTLLKLMLGLSSVDRGEILIDGIPMNKLGKSQYRKQISAVMQNDELLSGSVLDNIAFFETPVDLSWAINCAKLSAINEDIINMPMGYDSLVGDMGSNLSGGQKQRILLARALYKKPKILFMDEATSHLDLKLENDISQAIRNLNITRVIIAHRKETISTADREIRLLEQLTVQNDSISKEEIIV